MRKNKEETKMKTAKTMLITLIAIVALLIVSSFSSAQPSGTSITSNTTDTVTTSPPSSRVDEGGTITTLVVDAIQQNPRWKAYIGNITGSLTLDDSGGNTIYNWALDQSDITGEIYSSRNNSIDWGAISCADPATITAEDTFLTLSGRDSINNTFNETVHDTITVGTTAHNNCPATSTFVNSARETQGTASFQLVLLQDTTNLIYTSPIKTATTGYDGSLFDFQMIMANNPTATTPYYFYVELG